MAKLGEVCLLKAGKFVSANDISPEYNKGLYPCFGGNGIRGYVADYTHDGEFPLIGRQGALCGNVNLASGKFHATEHAVVVQPKIEMNVHWLYYALNAMNLGQYATGAAQPGLAVSKLETLSIEIPNISEQNKIAQTLYKVEQLVNFRKQQLAKLDELVKARFVEMFGNPVNNPMNYPKSQLGKVCDVRDGTHDSPEYYDVGYPLVTSKNVTGGKIDLSECNLISEDDYKKICERSKVDRGDIIMPMIGTVGKPVIVNTEPMFAIKNVALIKFTPDSLVTNIYIKTLLESDYFDRAVLDRIRGGTQKFIALGDIRKLEIILPDLKHQQCFSAFVERVDQQKQTVQQSLEKLELMKKALMQEYFG